MMCFKHAVHTYYKYKGAGSPDKNRTKKQHYFLSEKNAGKDAQIFFLKKNTKKFCQFRKKH